jgi:hypothetical protein
MNTSHLAALTEERNALERWVGEGGAPTDPYRSLARIETRLKHFAQRGRIGLVSSAPLPRASAFEDETTPGERTFGHYLINVTGTSHSQVIRASHSTAKRLARSRTQFGRARLSLLDVIDTPALD